MVLLGDISYVCLVSADRHMYQCVCICIPSFSPWKTWSSGIVPYAILRKIYFRIIYFRIIVRQEPFTKTKILLSACKVSKPHFNLAYLQVSSRPNSNRSLSTNLPLTAIAQAIQKIKVLYVSTGAWTGLQCKAKSRNNRFYKWPNPGYKASFNSRHTGTKCRDCHLSLCRQF